MSNHREKALEIAGIMAGRTGVNVHLVNAITTALGEIEDATYERAKQACEEQAELFLDPTYATPQPIGSAAERFACTKCIEAIQKLKES